MNPISRSAADHRARIAELQFEEEAMLTAILSEALPAMRAAWEASPGRIVTTAERLDNGSHPFARVGLVERKGDPGGTFVHNKEEIVIPGADYDFIWLEQTAWRPFDDDPTLLLQYGGTVNGEPQWQLRRLKGDNGGPNGHEERDYYGDMRPPRGVGIVWLREVGVDRKRWNDHCPWVDTIQQAREKNDGCGRLEFCQPGIGPGGIPNAVEVDVFDAGKRWLTANPIPWPESTSKTAKCPTCAATSQKLVSCYLIAKPDIYECPEHGMHQGGVLTGIRRTCTTCGHLECPCCRDWCDTILDEDAVPDDAESDLCCNGTCTYPETS